jgi:hypothetical protein
MKPQLSNDVLTAKDAETLAIAMREAVLVGKDIHPVEIERLCCFVIKGRALEMMSSTIHDLTVAMQAAVIEWQHGKGAEAGMVWISNTLWGPGLLPDEDAEYGKEAQAWFDANQAHPMPPCSVCGRPSNQLGGGVAACSVEHFRQAKEEAPNA